MPHRAGAGRDWSAERVERSTAVGARLKRGEKTWVVAFRKFGADEAVIEGRRFSESLLIR